MRSFKTTLFICIVILNTTPLRSEAQNEPPTIFINGEEYEVMPSDEKGSFTWQEAVERCKYKQAFGHSDWFVPDIDQLRALYAHQNAIGGFTEYWYWSSTQNNQYSSVVLNFKTGQSYPEGNNSRAVKCRYIRKTGKTKKTQNDYLWIYGEWIGKYKYYSHAIWTESYMVVSITPNRLVITDQGEQIYDGRYVIKDDLIEYIPYHNNYGWIGSDVWGFLEIMPDSHQIGSGYKRVLNKSKSYSYSDQPRQYNEQKGETSLYATITIESNDCEIFIDGKAVGNGRWKGALKRGDHTIKTIQYCYEPYEQNIKVIGGKDKTYSITPIRLKHKRINFSCNVGEASVVIDGMEITADPEGKLSLDLEMLKTHTLMVNAPGFVPITALFDVLEDKIICKSQEGLSSYEGKQSVLVKFDFEGIEIQLNKFNSRLYSGNDPKYANSIPVMGTDRIIVTGATIGSETACFREYYEKSRLMFSGSAGLALMPNNIETSLVFLPETEFEMPVEPYIGFGVGWQVFRGTGFRVTPQLGMMGCSVFYDPYVALCAKINVSYPLSDRVVVGVTPMMRFLVIEGLDTPYFYRNTSYGISLTLGWQKR